MEKKDDAGTLFSEKHALFGEKNVPLQDINCVDVPVDILVDNKQKEDELAETDIQQAARTGAAASRAA
ncbi:MAG: hypothetical protein IKG83_09450 [Prevotella sp.]|nr:hypothetical protein [Prevotella sp.]MBR7014339.1 hypothetical protein [Prevotella sp.]